MLAGVSGTRKKWGVLSIIDKTPTISESIWKNSAP